MEKMKVENNIYSV